MENISIEKVKSPMRKYMPWLTIVAVICILIGIITDIVASIDEAKKMWLGGALSYFVGEIIILFAVSAFLQAVHNMSGRPLLSMLFFTVTAIVYCLTSLIVNSTELYALEIENYNILGNLIIALHGISGLMYYIMFIVMWTILRHRFKGNLYLVGKWGLASVWTTIAFVIGCIIIVCLGFIMVSEETILLMLLIFSCVAIVGIIICLSLSLKAMMRAVEQTEKSNDEVNKPTMTSRILWYSVGGVMLTIVAALVIALCVDRNNEESSGTYDYDYNSGYDTEAKSERELSFGIDKELEKRLIHDYNCYAGIVRFCDRMSEIIEKAYTGDRLFDWSQLPEEEQLCSSENPDTVTYKRLQNIDRKTYKRLKTYFNSKDNVSPLFSLLPDFCAVSDGNPFESDADLTEAEYGNIIVSHFLDKKYNPEWLELFEMNMRQYLEDIHITHFNEKSDHVYEIEFSTSPHVRYLIDYSGEKVEIKCY